MPKKDKFHTIYVIEKRFRDHLIEWSATFFSILGAVFNALRYIEGFYIWTVASLLWIYFSWKHKHFGLLVTSLCYLVINIIGIIAWSGA